MGASSLIGLAGLGLGGYGAYQSTVAQNRQEDALNASRNRQAALDAERRASFQRTMDELKGNIDSFQPSGYSPDELKSLEDKVNFDTGEKGKDFSTSLIKSVIGRNINPNSGAVAGAAGDLALQLQKFKSGKLLDINSSSLAQKKTEELAKRNAQTSYLQAYDKGNAGITDTDLGLAQNDLSNINALQSQKGKQFNDLSSALLSSISDTDTSDPFGVDTAKKYIQNLFKPKAKKIALNEPGSVDYANV